MRFKGLIKIKSNKDGSSKKNKNKKNNILVNKENIEYNKCNMLLKVGFISE